MAGGLASLRFVRRRRGRILLRALTVMLVASGAAARAPSASAQLPMASIAISANEDRAHALTCLTEAIVYEAASEPIEGQQAVAQVILNRARSGTYPASICGVIYQGSTRRTGCQFTYTCDGALRRPMPSRHFAAARLVAQAALDGSLPDRVGAAMFYHAHYVSPRWAPALNRVGRIGAHIFYASAGASNGMARGVQFAAAMPAAGAIVAQPAPRPFSPWGLPLPTARALPPKGE